MNTQNQDDSSNEDSSNTSPEPDIWEQTWKKWKIKNKNEEF